MLFVKGICTECGREIYVDKNDVFTYCQKCGHLINVNEAIARVNEATSAYDKLHAAFKNSTGTSGHTAENHVDASASIRKQLAELDKRIKVKKKSTAAAAKSSPQKRAVAVQPSQKPQPVVSIPARTAAAASLPRSKPSDFIIRAGTLEKYEGMSSEVDIPNNVKIIGRNAFDGCVGLTSVMIPDSVDEIDEYAFSGCRRLTQLLIPNSVTRIGRNAFF